MEKKICAKGHFYDGDKYAQCPHCAEGRPPAVPSVFSVEKKETQQDSGSGKTEEKRKLFGRVKERRNKEHKGKIQGNAGVAEEGIQISNAGGNVTKGGSYTGGGHGTMKLPRGTVASAEKTGENEGILQGHSREMAGHKLQENGQVNGYFEAGARNGSRETAQGENSIQGVAGAGIADGTEDNWGYLQEETGTGDTNKEGQERIAEKGMKREMGDTGRIAADNPRRAAVQEEGKTIGFFSAGLDREPPVGYLICTAGEDYGTGFPLKSGNNSIGRSGSLDVVIMDVKVSREKQAYVMYEPHRREFYLKPGEGSGLCYLNDELLLEPKKLQAYDEILLGDTKLILIPVCGEKFSW